MKPQQPTRHDLDDASLPAGFDEEEIHTGREDVRWHTMQPNNTVKGVVIGSFKTKDERDFVKIWLTSPCIVQPPDGSLSLPGDELPEEVGPGTIVALQVRTQILKILRMVPERGHKPTHEVCVIPLGKLPVEGTRFEQWQFKWGSKPYRGRNEDWSPRRPSAPPAPGTPSTAAKHTTVADDDIPF